MDRRAAVRDNEEGSDDDDDEGGGSGKGGQKSGGAAGVLDQWQHCASVLCNAARIPEGRCERLSVALRRGAVRFVFIASRGWCALEAVERWGGCRCRYFLVCVPPLGFCAVLFALWVDVVLGSVHLLDNIILCIFFVVMCPFSRDEFFVLRVEVRRSISRHLTQPSPLVLLRMNRLTI